MNQLPQATLAIEVLYYTIVFLIKASILCTYLRFGESTPSPPSSDGDDAAIR